MCCYGKPFISFKLLPRNVRKSQLVLFFPSSSSSVSNAISLAERVVRTQFGVGFNFTLGGIIIYIWCGYIHGGV